MKIDVFYDFVCPICYMGERQLDIALEQFEHREDVEVNFHGFQVDPYAKKNAGMDIYQYTALKHGYTEEKARQMMGQMNSHVKNIGLDYQFDKLIPTNSYDAIRLFHYAKKEGKQNEYVKRVLRAHFTDGLDIGDATTLASLAKEVGLDEATARGVVTTGAYAEDVEADKALAEKHRIQGVPHFIINDKYSIFGAQPSDVILKTLEKAW